MRAESVQQFQSCLAFLYIEMNGVEGTSVVFHGSEHLSLSHMYMNIYIVTLHIATGMMHDIQQQFLDA
jgi:hypothetical protein